MIDKDPLDDSQVRCSSRESSVADEEEQKVLLSSVSTSLEEKQRVELDPASCQLDLVNDPTTSGFVPIGACALESDVVVDSDVSETSAESAGNCLSVNATMSQPIPVTSQEGNAVPSTTESSFLANNSKTQQCQALVPRPTFQLVPLPQPYPNLLTAQPKTLPKPQVSADDPPVPIVTQEQKCSPVPEQDRPTIMPQHGPVAPPSPAYIPHNVYPLIYQYPPQVGQPLPPLQYINPYHQYHPVPYIQQYPYPQPRYFQPIPEGQVPPQASAVPQSQPVASSQVHHQVQQKLQDPPVSAAVGTGNTSPEQVLHRDDASNPRFLHNQGFPQATPPPPPQGYPPPPLQQPRPQAPVPEGASTSPVASTFPIIQPHTTPRVGMRLQGPHHLFTVVPVGSGDLKEAQEEEGKPSIPVLPAKTIASPLRNFTPSLPPIMHTPPTSPISFSHAKAESMSSHLLKKGGPSSFRLSDCAEEPTRIPSPSDAAATSSSLSASQTNLSYPPVYFTLGSAKPTETTPNQSPYHTVTSMSYPQTISRREYGIGRSVSSPREFGIGRSATSPREFCRGGSGGLGGPSPFHPRGEYGVGGSSFSRMRKNSMQMALPNSPYHTITGMVTPSLPLRDYGIGGNKSPTFTRYSKQDIQRGGIPPSLRSVVLPKGSSFSNSKSTGSLKQLSWGYTVADNRSNQLRSPSSRKLCAQRWSGTHLVEETIDGALAPLLQEEQVTLNSAHQLTMQSTQQMTVHSMGGVSIEVGSSDGYSLTVRGALTSPEQLPYLPAVFRHGHLDACKAPHSADVEGEGRATWGNKAQFILACIGYAVGLGNLWRFPYLCYKSGGGAFLIPYFLMLFLCGIPLLLMELAIGQYTRRGPIGALEKLCPIFKGAGVGTVIMSFLLGTYYNVIIAWAIYYLFQSFTSELPWRSCDASWAVNCFDSYGSNVTAPNGTKSATEEYFDEVVLQKSKGIGDMGSFRLELLLALIGAWVMVYFCLWKSVKSSGKVVYVTATLPYLLIGAFLWRALTLPGASTGLKYFFTPKWELLLEGKVWVAAAAQNFNSIGIAFGSLIAFSSYNKFNNNIVLDTWAISLTNSFTSLLSGMIVFSTLGNIALEQSKDIDEVVAQGPGLVFMVYPQALAKMPYGGIWAVLFFFMLLILGLDSQFANVEVIITSLQDGFPKWLKNNLKHHEILVLIVCVISMVCGLPNVMQGGIYFFTLIDYYAANVSLMYLAFFEVVSIVWIYGAGRLARNVQEMTSRMPSWYFRGCWYICAPVLILAIWIFSVVDYEAPKYGNYEYPDWAIGLGWVIASLSIAPIPIFAVIAVCKAKGTNVWEKFKNSFRSQIEDCDCCGGMFNTDAEEVGKDEFLDRQVKLVVYNEGENEANKSPLSVDEKNEKNKETELNGKTN